MKHHPFRARNPLNLTKVGLAEHEVDVAEHKVGVAKLKVGGVAAPPSVGIGNSTRA